MTKYINICQIFINLPDYQLLNLVLVLKYNKTYFSNFLFINNKENINSKIIKNGKKKIKKIDIKNDKTDIKLVDINK